MLPYICSKLPDDEEITSESDADSEADKDGEKKEQKRAPKRHLKMADYPGFLAKRHQCFDQYRYLLISHDYCFVCVFAD